VTDGLVGWGVHRRVPARVERRSRATRFHCELGARPRRGPPSRDHEVFEDCTPPLAETCRPKAGSASPTCRGPGASYTAAVLPGPRTPLAAAVTAIALAASPGCD